MIQKRMRVSMAVTLAMLFVMLAFGRGQLAWLYDDVGTAAAEFAAAFRQDHLEEDGGTRASGEAQGRLRNEIPRVGRTITPPVTARSTGTAPAANPSQDSSAGRAEQSEAGAGAGPEPEVPADEPPALPDPQAVRDSAIAELDALDPLHDELIEVLEAIHEALTDREEKRQARNRVALARFTKRHDRGRFEAAAAAELEWRVRSARRGTAGVRARLERQIQEARADLARVRQSP